MLSFPASKTSSRDNLAAQTALKTEGYQLRFRHYKAFCEVYLPYLMLHLTLLLDS
jgi:hypothetical protein